MTLAQIKQKVYDIVISKKGQKKAITAESLGGLLYDMCDYSTTPDSITASTINAGTINANSLKGDAVKQFATEEDIEVLATKQDLDSSAMEKLEPLKHIKLWSYDIGREEEEENGVVLLKDKEETFRVLELLFTKTIESRAGLISDADFIHILEGDVYEAYSSQKEEIGPQVLYKQVTSGQINFCDFAQDKYSLYVVAQIETSYYLFIFNSKKLPHDTVGLDLLISFDRNRICGLKYNKMNIRFITFGPKREE